MTFGEYIKKLKEEDRKTIKTRINSIRHDSPIMLQMVQNLCLEDHFKENDWKELADNLLHSLSGNDKTEHIIRDFCRNNRILKGEEAKINSERILGRVISFKRFCNLLVELGYHVTIEEAEVYMRSLMSKPISELPDEWKERKIGRFLMWSTFNKRGRMPFGNPRPKAAIIVCTLGLPLLEGPYILLIYQLVDEPIPRVPTFCDAYAGNFWSKYFRTSSPGAEYGLTMPTDTCPDQKPRPEVVHEVIKGEKLVEPIRYA